MKRLYIAAAAAGLILCLLLPAVFFTESVPTGSWGLSFGAEGVTPSGPLSSKKLSELGAAYSGTPEEKVLYLTFDAGYENGYTADILDVLNKHGAPAAFFLVGDYLERNADLVRRMADEGHTVGNHTLTHPDMSAISDPEALRRELEGVEALYRDITGQELPKFYRPPQGIYSEENLCQAKELGYRTVFWSLAYADWDNESQPDPGEAMDLLCRRVHPGAVVLLHSTSRTNAQILDDLLTRWEEMGYRFAELEELFAGM